VIGEEKSSEKDRRGRDEATDLESSIEQRDTAGKGKISYEQKILQGERRDLKLTLPHCCISFPFFFPPLLAQGVEG